MNQNSGAYVNYDATFKGYATITYKGKLNGVLKSGNLETCDFSVLSTYSHLIPSSLKKNILCPPVDVATMI